MGGPHVSGVRGIKAGRPARITPRVLQRVSSPPAPTPLVGMASKANCRNRDEEQPLSRPTLHPLGRLVVFHARGNRGKDCHRGTSRKNRASKREPRCCASELHRNQHRSFILFVGKPRVNFRGASS